MSWFVPIAGDCSCNCNIPCPVTDCGDETEKTITQVVFSVTLNNTFDVWTTDSFSTPVRRIRTRYTGLSALSGTYTVNRQAYPSCGWDFPETSESISWESRYWSNGSDFSLFTGCITGGGTFLDSGSDSWGPIWGGQPTSHQITIGNGAVAFFFEPVTHLPCGQSDIEASHSDGGTCVGGGVTDTGTATSYE